MGFLVQREGLADETIVKKVSKVVDSWGYRKMVIKTGGRMLFAKESIR